MDGPKIRCQCKKGKHICYLPVDEVNLYLLIKWFVPNYFKWTGQGEPLICNISRGNKVNLLMNMDEFEGRTGFIANNVAATENPSTKVVYDAVGYIFQVNIENLKEEPNPNAKIFFDLLKLAGQELGPNCETMAQLSLIAKILNIKSEEYISDGGLEKILAGKIESLRSDNKMVDNFYNMKKLIKGLDLPVEEIDCGNLGCMMLWGDDMELQSTNFTVSIGSNQESLQQSRN